MSFAAWLNPRQPKADVWCRSTLSEVGGCSPQYVRQVLEGSVVYLSASFVWSKTPQGNEYWSLRSVGEVALSEDDRAFLSELAALEEDK